MRLAFISKIVNQNKFIIYLWSGENPHYVSKLPTHYSEKLIVWAGILGNHLVGPFIFEESLTGELRYN